CVDARPDRQIRRQGIGTGIGGEGLQVARRQRSRTAAGLSSKGATVTEVRERQNTYLAAFERMERDLSAFGTPAVHRLRKAAAARFAELGFPGPRDEEWRFSPIAPLARIPFEPALSDRAEKSCSLRNSSLPKGAIVCGLAEAMQKHASLIEP